MPAQSPTFVADVVAITAGFARVVLGDAGLDLADEVGADVGALREMPPPSRAKTEISEPPKPRPMSASTGLLLRTCRR